MRTSDHVEVPRRGRRARRRVLLGLLLGVLVVVAVFAATAALLLPAAGPRAARAHAASQRAANAVHFVQHPEPVPILLYHHVYVSSGARREMWVSVSEFRAQLHWLSAHHYHPVTLGAVYDAWTGNGTLPSRPVVLTFDDGYAEQYTTVARMLARYGWPADLCLVAHHGVRLHNWMVARMIKAGWELVSHTVHHPKLTRISSARLRREIVGSREELERTFHVRVRFFCYPYGAYDARVAAAVERAGYEAALGTRYAAAVPNDLYALPRIHSYHGASLAGFGRRLRGAVRAARAAREQR
jgi:peptidoglycan/xylan/chitin deacetylase (PgdA/CDA1 family)